VASLSHLADTQHHQANALDIFRICADYAFLVTMTVPMHSVWFPMGAACTHSMLDVCAAMTAELMMLRTELTSAWDQLPSSVAQTV